MHQFPSSFSNSNLHPPLCHLPVELSLIEVEQVVPPLHINMHFPSKFPLIFLLLCHHCLPLAPDFMLSCSSCQYSMSYPLCSHSVWTLFMRVSLWVSIYLLYIKMSILRYCATALCTKTWILPYFQASSVTHQFTMTVCLWLLKVHS